jgi:hypothetical protein
LLFLRIFIFKNSTNSEKKIEKYRDLEQHIQFIRKDVESFRKEAKYIFAEENITGEEPPPRDLFTNEYFSDMD